MAAYYNEFDPFAASWLRNLIAAGHLPAGDVDERSIVDVRADDLRGYSAVHMFAGIGGWPYALRLAGVPDSAAVWTGSCPCQPFSAAGKGDGAADERHLWPAWFALIRECRPELVFGEQVSAAIRLGWLDGVFTDVEREGYTTGAAVLGAHSVGAPHIRQRLYWLAARRVADTAVVGYRSQAIRDEVAWPEGFGSAGWTGRSSAGSGLAHASSGGFGIDGSAQGRAGHADIGVTADGLGDPNDAGRQRSGPELPRRCNQQLAAKPGGGAWDDYELIPCGDGPRARRIKPGLATLASRIPNRVGRLRGYGNALTAPLAAEFVTAALEALE